VQQKLFPRQMHKLKTIDYAGQCVAAREVGGDYYDFLEAGDSSLAFVLGDVSGKGVPAALLMANLQACFRSQSATALQQPGTLLRTVNNHFFESTEAERFATLFFGLYDDRTRRLRYVNCGHVAPLLMRPWGELERLGPTATMLGAFRQWRCGEGEIALHPSDVLVLYSDGVTEAGMDGDEDFGEQRLIAEIRAHQFEPAESLVQSIVETVTHYSSGARFDDITVVAIRGV
jgi:serine phosphatase RsbU (regulator of sigma subunit)